MKKKNGRASGFLLGFLACALLLGIAIPAIGAGNLFTLEDVMVGGITIILDGEELHPVDANGKAVDAMIYNGTTYLPVRAVASAVGKSVYWDGPSYTVYLGDMGGTLEYPTVMLTDMENINANLTRTTTRLKDNYGNSYSSAVYNMWNNTEHEYLLNMKYNRFKGTLYIPEGEKTDGEVVFSIKADGHLIFTSPIMTKTSVPVPIDVDVTGYNDFVLSWNGNNHAVLCLADAGFYQ